MVIYTPPGEPFFCLENQTCSTDAHNLYDKGFREESGLRFAGAGAVAAGTVRYWLVRAFDI
jgi:aldose 1-epimerase